MTDVADRKRRAIDAIDDHAADIVAFAEDVEAEPELGFKETETTKKVVAELAGMGLDVEENIAVTGAKARLNADTAAETESNEEFVVAILGELDALVNPAHPKANPETGACHACGHHAQLANLVGAAYGLTAAGVVDDLAGAIDFVAVPAEEYLDLGYRRQLVESGDVEFLGGKQELIRRGHFDDVDCAMMIHAGSDTPERVVTSDFSSNGFVGKFVTYEGKESHAGAAPEEGVNALNAAMLGMNAVHANRETFADDDHVRVHPIVTNGGDGVNVVPSDVQMESYVRASSIEAVSDANEKTNRALESGAMAVGANVEIEDYPGYMPLRTDETMVSAYDANVAEILGDEALTPGKPHLTGSTDMGDVTQMLPGIHPYVGGFSGAVHARDFEVVDEEMAYVIPAKLTAMLVIDLLSDLEKQAEIRAAKEDKRTAEEYLEVVRGMRETVVGEYSE